MSKGRLFVISGASGVGKSTVLGKVMGARNDLSFSVSATTRPPRPGEVEGKSYYFVSRDRFEEMIRQDAVLEYDEHAGNFYGTPRQQLEEKLEKYNMEKEVVRPKSEATIKKFQKQHLTTDTGIEITIPMEEYKDPEKVEFITNLDGTISVLIKNIGHLSTR